MNYKDILFKSMSSSDLDEYRIKAILSFDEEERANDFNGWTHTYKNIKGDVLKCYILIERDNGDIVVKNENGANCCLTKERLTLIDG